MEYWTWQIAFETGWTLEYIERLPLGRFHEWLAVKDASAKATKRGRS